MEEAVTEPTQGSTSALRPIAIVWLLGLSQIVGYGTLYYSFSILAGSAAAELGWPVSWLYGSLSIALLIGGLVAPEVGRRIDRHGAGPVMTLGSIAAAAMLFVAAVSPSGIAFAICVVGMQVTGAFVLYDAAFAALVQTTGSEARARITHLTLIAGFASTIFWPLTAWLQGMLSWREIYLVFAVANLLLCLPIHVMLVRHHRIARIVPQTPAVAAAAMVPEVRRRRVLWLITIGFALAGFALSAMLTQMVPMLTQLGLGASALAVSALFGPAQVLVRFVNMLVGAKRHPMAATFIALAMLPLSLVVLAATGPSLIGATVFAILFGFGSGLKSIVQGTLPLALFGSSSYGARLGFMAAMRQGLAAFAPFILAFTSEATGAATGLWLTVAVGACGLLCMIMVWVQTREG